MNFLFLRILTVLAPFLMAAQVQAADFGIFLEPYAGYSIVGSLRGEQLNRNYHGLTVGSRAGIELGGFLFVGPDFIWLPSGSGNLEAGNTKITDDSKFSLGLTAGIIIPDTSFRLWFGYYPIEQMSFSSTGLQQVPNVDNYKLLGNSIKLGVGYKLLSYLSLNAEYVYAKYNNLETTSLSTKQVKENTSFASNSSSVLLSLSVPLTFALE